MTIAVTGHRPHRLGNEYDLVGPYSDAITIALEAQINRFKPDTLISGMALGVDTIWALLALKHGLKLIAAIPFRGQEKKWPKPSQDRYNKILYHSPCQIVVVSEGGYSALKMQLRNQWMVDHCHHLIAIWNGSEGGTANCVKYARKQRRDMTIINPQKLF